MTDFEGFEGELNKQEAGGDFKKPEPFEGVRTRAVKRPSLKDLFPEPMSSDKKHSNDYVDELTKHTLRKWYVKYPTRICSFALFVGINILGNVSYLAILSGFAAASGLIYLVPLLVSLYHAKKQGIL